MNVKLDGELERFARRALEVEFPYHILAARYKKVREEGAIRSRAVLVAIGIDWEGCRQHLAAWLERWAAKHPKLTTWVEEQIEETFTFYRLPHTHHKHLKSTNLLERFNQELKRRSLVVRMLPAPSGAALRAACGRLSRSARIPNDASCLRLIRALASEQHEEWLDGARYLDIQPLADLHQSRLQLAA